MDVPFPLPFRSTIARLPAAVPASRARLPEPRRSSLIEGFARMSSSFNAMQCVRRDTRRAWCRHAGMDAHKTAAMVKWGRIHQLREHAMFRFRVANLLATRRFPSVTAGHVDALNFSLTTRRHPLRRTLPCALRKPRPTEHVRFHCRSQPRCLSLSDDQRLPRPLKR